MACYKITMQNIMIDDYEKSKVKMKRSKKKKQYASDR